MIEVQTLTLLLMYVYKFYWLFVISSIKKRFEGVYFFPTMLYIANGLVVKFHEALLCEMAGYNKTAMFLKKWKT